MTGGKHFVVNTGDNGRGPLDPAATSSTRATRCSATRPAAGSGRCRRPAPATRNVDMFAWTTNPGESGGACVPGAPATGVYWPAYALMLVRNANFSVR